MNLSIPERIDKILKHYQINQKKLSLKSGVHENTLSNAKKGKCIPNIMFFNLIHIAYPEIKPLWLYSGDGEMLEPIIKEKPLSEKMTIEFLQNENILLKEKIKDKEEIINLMKL